MQRLLGHRLFVILPIIYTVLLTVGSLMKPVKIEDAPDHFDKILHASAYFGLTVLWLTWGISRRYSSRKIITSVGLLAIVYGVLMEVFQGALTDYRSADFLDVIANTTGVLLGLGIILVLIRKTTLLKTKF